MIAYKPADILLIPFPFSDLHASKKRPAALLATVSSKKLPTLYILAMITSQVESENILGDYHLTHWEEAGLLHESKIRLGKLVTIEENLIQKKLGEIQSKDWSALKKEFKKVFHSII